MYVIESIKTIDGVDRAVPVSMAAPLPVLASNITGKFREAFEAYAPGDKWLESKASGDIVAVDGNAVAASYLVISKSPWSLGATSVESLASFTMPVELAVGLSLSQRTLGQEFAIELVGGQDAPVTPELQIASISQTTTTLSITTVEPHNLAPGRRIGVRGVQDARLNLPALVVASIPAPNQLTVTAGPAGAIASLTVGPFAGGYVYARAALGGAGDGASMMFENAVATTASFYLRSSSGDALPSGVVTGAHGVTVATTASVQAVNAANTYAFQPSSEYRLVCQSDRVQWSDAVVDAVATATARVTRTQVCPTPTANYKFRIRAVNNASLTTPSAQIVAAVKTGTTTATLTADRPHGLLLGDPVVVYGLRDTVNFPNLVVGTAVASVVDAFTFTLVIGPAATATSYGGYVALVQGGNLMSALGASAVVAQSAALATAVDGSRQLTLTGSAAWTGLLIGDYAELVGLRNAVDGGLMALDGAWKVASLVTTTLTLVPVGGTAAPADFGAVNCGGGLIKRTDLRVSFVRLFDYERERVEVLARPTGDIAGAISVAVQNALTVSGTVAATQGARGVVGAGWYVAPDNALVNDVVAAALTVSATTVAIIPTPVGAASEFNIIVTAASGTLPTLDVGVEESDDTGVNWYRIYDFPRITAAGAYRTPVLALSGNRLRYVQTVGGTTPSFTRAVNRITHQMVSPPPLRQLVDRTLAPTVLNSVTPSLKTGGAAHVQLVLSLGAAATPPELQLEGSDDNGASWSALGAPLAGVAASTVRLTVVSAHTELVRARVSAAGAGATLGYALVKAFGA